MTKRKTKAKGNGKAGNVTVSGFAALDDVRFVDRLAAKTRLSRSFYLALALREFVARRRRRAA